MSVSAIGNYDYTSHDNAADFAQPLLYIAWDAHMMFAAPAVQLLAMTTRFAELQSSVLPSLYGTLAEHGFGHKSVLRFRTPGLEGLRGSCG